MKKQFVCLCSLLLVLGASVSANVLLYDTFADGSRVETNLPDESGVWASSPGDVAMGVGSLKQTMGSSSRRLHTYFAPAGSPASLNVGEQLVATIAFIPEGAFNDTTSRNFRFGLFYDDVQHAQDSVGDSGVSNSWQDATGYAAQFSLGGTDTAATARVGKRNSTSASLLGSEGAYLWGSNGGQANNLTLNTLYTMTLMLDYVQADLMRVTFTFAQGDTVIATATTDDTELGGTAVNTDFDFLLFRLSSNSGTADVLNFQSIKIEHVIPEPATIALLGLGGLLSVRRRRS